MRPVNWLVNRQADCAACEVESEKLIPTGEVSQVRKFHLGVPGFEATPLKSLPNLSKMLGVGAIWVKDEALRFELTSFKVLGGSYAIYRILKKKLNLDYDVSFEELARGDLRKRLGDITFATATDGNHGRGVAWTAGRLGQKSVVYVPRETKEFRIRAIKKYGAEVRVIDGTYDEAVEKIKEDAQKHSWQVVSDTAWDGYEEIPRWVMRGYGTIFSEIDEQIREIKEAAPTHIFLQAGVGSLAAAAVSYWSRQCGETIPKFVITEPDRAACIFESIRVGDGNPHMFPGMLDTIMAGLSCGRPNPLAWDVLKNCPDVFLSCSDYVAARGMRVYAVPLEGDPFIVSGESGAVTLGALTFIMQRPELENLRKILSIGHDSRILLINTEGDTDPLYFRQIVWEGAHPVPEGISIGRTR